MRLVPTRHWKIAERDVVHQRDAAYMQERWDEELREDSSYSPNLSLASPGFGLAFPPRWFLRDCIRGELLLFGWNFLPRYAE